MNVKINWAYLYSNVNYIFIWPSQSYLSRKLIGCIQFPCLNQAWEGSLKLKKLIFVINFKNRILQHLTNRKYVSFKSKHFLKPYIIWIMQICVGICEYRFFFEDVWNIYHKYQWWADAALNTLIFPVKMKNFKCKIP